jgi:hypothetical protein
VNSSWAPDRARLCRLRKYARLIDPAWNLLDVIEKASES